VIEGKSFNALLDISSHLSLREDDFRTIKTRLQKSEVFLTGIAQGQVKMLGYFQTTITIDNLLFPLTFHVVPCKALTIN